MPAIRPTGLVARARAGDATAQRALYDRHVAAVFGYCLAFCRGDREAALDLCQEAFARAFSGLGDLRDDDAFPGWLMTTTRRLCLRWIEARQAERRAVSALADEPPAPTGNARDRVSAIVEEVVLACPDADLRETARLFYLPPPRSTDSIGRALGVSRTAVTTRLWRFRAWARANMLGRLAAALEEAS